VETAAELILSWTTCSQNSNNCPKKWNCLEKGALSLAFNGGAIKINVAVMMPAKVHKTEKVPGKNGLI